MKIPRLIAHRGASQYAPENTLPALARASTMGAQWLEFDVQLTKDQQVVVIHDDTLQRTTGQSGFVCDYTLSQLSTFDAGRFFDEKFAGTTIPTFRQWLGQANELGLSLNIELKPAKTEHHARLIEAVIEELELFFSDATNRVIVSSFDRACLESFHCVAPEYQIAALFHQWDDNWQCFAERVDALSVNVNCEILTQQRVQEIKAKGYKLLSYTVNDKEKAQLLFSWGVDGVFSDAPDLLL